MDLTTIAFAANIIALCSGMAGTALIYRFGVPRQVDTGGVNFMALEGDQRYDQDEIVRIKYYKRLGNTGLALVGFAFLLQLVALIGNLPST